MNKTVFLLTGRPGCGKTTLVRGVVESLPLRAAGFYTRELRAPDGRRRGFEIVTLDGQRATLAHVDIHSPYRVSRYGVDVPSIDAVAVPAIQRARQECDLVVIDEIGKMELYSEAFRAAVLAAVDSGKCVLGTILLGSHPWADGIRVRPSVQLFRLSEANRDEVRASLLSLVESCAKGSAGG
jgi:nucleoside-triphosphatase